MYERSAGPNVSNLATSLREVAAFRASGLCITEGHSDSPVLLRAAIPVAMNDGELRSEAHSLSHLVQMPRNMAQNLPVSHLDFITVFRQPCCEVGIETARSGSHLEPCLLLQAARCVDGDFTTQASSPARVSSAPGNAGRSPSCGARGSSSLRKMCGSEMGQVQSWKLAKPARKGPRKPAVDRDGNSNLRGHLTLLETASPQALREGNS
jgi:hypothetical protein